MIVAEAHTYAVQLPVTPFIVLGVIFVVSLAVFLWITRSKQ